MIKKSVPYIPLAAIAATLLYTCFFVLIRVYDFDLRHIVAMMLVLANIIVYIARFSPRVGRRFTLAIILLGCFNVLAFTPVIYWWTFTTLKIPFQPYSFLLLIIFLICNFRYLEKYRK